MSVSNKQIINKINLWRHQLEFYVRDDVITKAMIISMIEDMTMLCGDILKESDVNI
jgi:hypothetical protein